MAAKSAKLKKTSKPRIRVEEIVEEKPEASMPPRTQGHVEPPKIASFSQLDSTLIDSMPVSAAPVKEENSAKPETTEPPASPSIVEPASLEQANESETEETSEKMSSDEVKEWLKDIRPDTTKEVEKGGGFDFKLFFGFLVLFALIGALIGGLYYYKQRVAGMTPETNNNGSSGTEVTETPEPTATPAPTVDLSKLKVSVLNGSGISGEAGRVESLLVKGGFSDANVATGNASLFNHTTTSVMMKKTTPAEVFDKIKAALGDGYEVVKGVGDLNDSSTNDIEITVGKKG